MYKQEHKMKGYVLKKINIDYKNINDHVSQNN